MARIAKRVLEFRERHRRGSIMRPSTFAEIEREAAAGGMRDPRAVAGAAYWKTLAARYRGGNPISEEPDPKYAGEMRFVECRRAMLTFINSHWYGGTLSDGEIRHIAHIVHMPPEAGADWSFIRDADDQDVIAVFLYVQGRHPELGPHRGFNPADEKTAAVRAFRKMEKLTAAGKTEQSNRIRLQLARLNQRMGWKMADVAAFARGGNPYFQETLTRGSRQVVIWANDENGPFHVDKYLNDGETPAGKLTVRPIKSLKKARQRGEKWLAAMSGSNPRNPAVYDGNKYRAVVRPIGTTISRKSDGASVFLQGDDASEIEEQLDALLLTHIRGGYPSGPFQTYEQHLDAVLDAYDDVMQQGNPRRHKTVPEILRDCDNLKTALRYRMGNPTYQVIAVRKGGTLGQTIDMEFGTLKQAKEYAKTIDRDVFKKPVITVKGARGNPDGDEGELSRAEDLYKTFHGREPREILELTESAEQRGEYVALGDLVELTIISPEDDHVKLGFKQDGVRVASSPEGTQLYLLGGTQDISGSLRTFGADASKDLIDLGELKQIVYDASKWQTDFTPQEWKHDLGEESGIRPRAFFDQLKKRIFFAGGTYAVKRPGIVD